MEFQVTISIREPYKTGGNIPNETKKKFSGKSSNYTENFFLFQWE